MAAATQNQALNALVFLYREVIGGELGWLVVVAADPRVYVARYAEPDKAPTVGWFAEPAVVARQLDDVQKSRSLLDMDPPEHTRMRTLAIPRGAVSAAVRRIWPRVCPAGASQAAAARSASRSVSIEVTPVNDAPVAVADALSVPLTVRRPPLLAFKFPNSQVRVLPLTNGEPL